MRDIFQEDILIRMEEAELPRVNTCLPERKLLRRQAFCFRSGI